MFKASLSSFECYFKLRSSLCLLGVDNRHLIMISYVLLARSSIAVTGSRRDEETQSYLFRPCGQNPPFVHPLQPHNRGTMLQPHTLTQMSSLLDTCISENHSPITTTTRNDLGRSPSHAKYLG